MKKETKGGDGVGIGIKKSFHLTVEPIGFLYLSGLIIQHIVIPNLYLTKVCTVNFNMSASMCDTHNQSMHGGGFRANNTGAVRLINQVQAYVTNLNIYVTLIDNIPSIFFVLFLIPWSDTHGRKMLMIIPITGHILQTLIYIANYYAEDWSAEFLLIAQVPVGLMGGMVTFMIALNRYLVDITTEEDRTFRLSIFTGIVGIKRFSVPIAHIVSIYILKGGGVMAVFGTTLGLLTSSLLYTIFFVTESRKRSPPSKKIEPKKTLSDKENNIVNEFDVGNKNECAAIARKLFDCFVVTFKPREGHKRAIVLILMSTMCLNLLSGSPHGVGYLYTRKKLQWDAPDFAMYITVNSGVAACGTLIFLPVLSKIFNVRDGAIGVISLLGNFGSHVTVAFATTTLMMYLSTLGHILTTGIGVVIRSMLSKSVSGYELSHVFAVLACIESILPLIASPTFNIVYKATLATFPGTVYLLDAALVLILTVLYLTVLILQKKEKKIFDSEMNIVQPFPSTDVNEEN